MAIIHRALQCIALLLLGLNGVNANSSGACASANPTLVKDVFECVATATLNQYSNVNPFSNTQRAQCSQLQMIYMRVLQQQGVSREDLPEKLPECKTFAKVLVELNGAPPFWQACLDYDGTAAHMSSCLLGISQSAGNNASKQILANCTIAYTYYETLLMSLNGDGTNPALPGDYAKVECDEFLAQLQRVETAIDDVPCAGFKASEINTHARQCLLSSEALTQSSGPIDCQMMRRVYETSLVQVYGKRPDGYRLLSCAVLNEIKRELKSPRFPSEGS
ncbi:hypothetical protein [Congregibacter litoralis]|uniref:Secreted protein n=1 Tax=Congregibacter litoralis KT71 TaxID=314285 RepID=A4A951_9GAMM|nr:hypothetical protein [Congregibacter litoralis]EAQ97593.1 hypothetical protein KT71_04770 [Congregibacter litoralis KT71]